MQAQVPNYDAMFIAAYKNDLVGLQALLNVPGVDRARVYESSCEPLKQIPGGIWYYGKKAITGVSGSVGVMGCIAEGVALVTAATPPGFIVFSGLCFATGLASWFVGEASATWYATNKNGWTLLHFAAAGGAVGVIDYLIDQGFDPRITDRSDRTCADVASIFGFPKVNTLLVNKMGALHGAAVQQVAAVGVELAAAHQAVADAGRREGEALVMLNTLLLSSGTSVAPGGGAAGGAAAAGGAGASPAPR